MAIEKKFTEAELLLLLEQKNENIVSYLYDTYAPQIYGLIIKELKNEQLASQILQSAFIKIAIECKNAECVKQRLFMWMWSLTQSTARSRFKVSLDMTALKNLKRAETNYFTSPKSGSLTTYNSSSLLY